MAGAAAGQAAALGQTAALMNLINQQRLAASGLAGPGVVPTLAAASSASLQLTREQRRVYVGNVPLNTTEVCVRAPVPTACLVFFFFVSSCLVWFSSRGSFI